MDAIIKQGAEFGVVAFLLVITLCGSGYALWRIGNRIVDYTGDSLKRQADSADRTSLAVLKISDLAALSQMQHDRANDLLASHDSKLASIQACVSQNSKALHAIVSAATDAIPHDHLPPDQQQRIKGYLEQARRYLNRDE